MPRPAPASADMPVGPSSTARAATLAAASIATAAALALAVWAVLNHGNTPPSLPWLLTAAVACVAAAVGWTLWRQRDLACALADARLEAQGLSELIGAWQWRSDGAHRLMSMRPPAATGVDDKLGRGAIGRTLWEQLGVDAATAAGLRTRLDSGARLDGLRVSRQLDTGVRQPLELQALPLLDHRGLRVGYLGSLRSLDAAATGDADRGLLQTLLATLPAPVFVLAGSGSVPTQVELGNAAATQWLGLAPAQLAALAVGGLLSRLPADLRAPVERALARPEDAPPEPAVGADWTAHLRRVAPDAEGGSATAPAVARWILAFAPTVPAAASTAETVAEHESFSYTVSHDLRAPIRVVEGFARILKEDYGRQLDRIGVDHLDRVLGAAARMNSMIDALLALSQLSTRPLSRQPVNLSQLAAYVVEDLRRQSPERAVTVQIEPGLQTQGDPTLLRMVLENLLGNAWKYSARRRDARIWLEHGLHDDRPCFSVRDNGAGFDMRFADRLFGVFQRLHSANDFPGTGVGLASVRRIIARHGGEIWAESAVDQGSSFHFTLPSGHSAG